MAVPKRKKAKAWKRHKIMLNFIKINNKSNQFSNLKKLNFFKKNLYDIFII